MPDVGYYNAFTNWLKGISQSPADAARQQQYVQTPVNLAGIAKSVEEIRAGLYGNADSSLYGGQPGGTPNGGYLNDVRLTYGNTADMLVAIRDPTVGLAALAAAINASPDMVVDDWNSYTEGGFTGLGQNIQLLQAAGISGLTQTRVGTFRSLNNTNLLINIEALTEDGNSPTIFNFGLADPASKLGIEETDQEMLQRLYPSNGWNQGQFGGPQVGCTVLNADDSVVNYVYSPRPPSLLEFWKLWIYTPASGPPARNGITDYLQLLTVAPFQYGP